MTSSGRTYGRFHCVECGRRVPYIVGPPGPDPSELTAIVCFRCHARAPKTPSAPPKGATRP